jgi:hypothetical protein
MTWPVGDSNGGGWTTDIIACCKARVEERPITVNLTGMALKPDRRCGWRT